MNFIIGLAMIGVGFVIVWQSEWLLENFGSISFFEDKLRTEGGSRLGYKLIGIIIIFFGVLVLTGMIKGFALWALSPLTQYSQQMPISN